MPSGRDAFFCASALTDGAKAVKPTFRGRRRFLIDPEGPLPTYELRIDGSIPRLEFSMDSFILYGFFESRRAIPRKWLYDTTATREFTFDKV